MPHEIRPARLADLESILGLFRDCVRSICRNDYTEGQLDAWISSAENNSCWSNKIEHDYFLVAIGRGSIIGFGSLEGRETIDLLYVDRDFQRSGVAASLLGALSDRAKHLGASVLRAEVSKTARGFFERYGFVVIEHQSKESGGVALENLVMTKSIG